MSLVKDEINDTTTANMEYEDKDDKVKVEEVYINLGCVKQEYDEAIDLEGNSENKGFEGDVVLIETAFVKTEDIKEETTSISAKTKDFCCNKCGRNYQGYCSNCSTLSHILNKIVPTLNIEADLKAVPTNILELKDILSRKGIFTLKILPNGVIFGPFKGASTSTNGWKIKDSKFITEKNANWMKYIACASNQFSKNLDIFQLEGSLYFQTNREIKVGEELLICYTQEALIKLEKEDGCCFVPVVREESWKIFACTLCCLGFRLESCLMEHKSKCPHGNGEIEDFEVIECNGCKLWLEKREHQESHMLYCIEKTRIWNNLPNFQPELKIEVDHDDDAIDQNDINDNILSVASKVVENWFECDICKIKFRLKDSLNRHNNYKHSKTKKDHAHKNIKGYECNICKKKFVRNTTLKDHKKYIHSGGTNVKEYKCSQCSFETHRKQGLQLHLEIHNKHAEKHYNCPKCPFQTYAKNNLNKHLNKHKNKLKDNGFKCPHCSFQTFYKGYLKKHIDTIHPNDGSKRYQCGVCKKQFTQKSIWNLHIKTEHSRDTEEKYQYQCLECPYQTNATSKFKRHGYTHIDVKSFQCDICKKRYTQKDNLRTHIKNKHSGTEEKNYKCSKCSYQTNFKDALSRHLNTHEDVKPFQCDTCDKSYCGQKALKAHIQQKHLKTKEENF